MSLPGRLLRTFRISYSTLPKFGYNVKRAKEKAKRQEDSDILHNILENRKIQSAEDVIFLKNELQSKGNFSPKGIDRVLLNYFINARNYETGLNYIEFLDEQTKSKLNLFLTHQMFRMYFYKRVAEKKITEEHQNFLIEMYNKLKESYPVLDVTSLESAILALSITKKWKISLNLLDEIRALDKPSSSSYSAVVAAAFINNEEELAWNIFSEMFEKGRTPHNIVFSAYIEKIQKLSNKNEAIKKLEHLFRECADRDIVFSEEIILELRELLNQFKMVNELSTVKRGCCTNCQTKLDNLELTNEVFEKLKQKIVNNVIVGKNIFSKTTPEEFSRFQNFLESCNNYDVVIDGLNVAYTAGTRQSDVVYSTLLFHVVKYFVDKGKKIVVLGRVHMRKWPKNFWNYVENNSKIFLTQDISQDDPYLLYCALHCGKDAIIVSKDLMRSHLFLLKKPKDKLIFSRWLIQRQYQLNFVTNEGRVHFKFPMPYTRSMQKNGDFWHIPYNPPNIDPKNEILNTCLCLRFKR